MKDVLQKMLDRWVKDMNKEQLERDINENMGDYKTLFDLVEKNFPELKQKYLDNGKENNLIDLYTFLSNNTK